MKQMKRVISALCIAGLTVLFAVPATAALTFTDISGERVLAVDSAENVAATIFRATADVTLKLSGGATDGEFPFKANIYVPDAATTVTVDISDVTGDCTGIRMTGGLRGAGAIAFGTGVKTLRFGAPPPQGYNNVLHLVAFDAQVSFAEQDGTVEFVEASSLLVKPASYTIAAGATVAPFVKDFFDVDELTLDTFDLVICSAVSVKEGCTVKICEGRKVYHRPANIRSPTGSDISIFSQWSGQHNHAYALNLALDGGVFETQLRTTGCSITGGISGSGTLKLYAPGGELDFIGKHDFTGTVNSICNSAESGTIKFSSAAGSSFENVDVNMHPANYADVILFAPQSGAVAVGSVTGSKPSATGYYNQLRVGAGCKVSVGRTSGTLAFGGAGDSAEVELLAMDSAQIYELPGVTMTLDDFGSTCSFVLLPQDGAEKRWSLRGGTDEELDVRVTAMDPSEGELCLGGKLQLVDVVPCQTVRIAKDAEIRACLPDGTKVINEGGTLDLVPTWKTKVGLWFDASAAASISNALDHVSSKGWSTKDFKESHVYEWSDCRPLQRAYRIRASKYDTSSTSLSPAVFPEFKSDENGAYMSWSTKGKTRTPLAGDKYTGDNLTYAAKTVIAVFGSQLGGGNAMLTTTDARLARTKEIEGSDYKASWPICLDTTISVRTNGVPVNGSETGFNGVWQIVTLETDDAVSVKGIAHPSELASSTGNGGQNYRELLVFSERLTETERFEVEKYLAEKWNLPIAGTAPAGPAKTFSLVGSGALSLAGDVTYGTDGDFSGTVNLNGRRLEIADIRLPCSDADVPADGRLLWVDPRYEGAVVPANDGYGAADEVKMIYARDNAGLLTADKSLYLTSPIKEDGTLDRRVRYVDGWLDFRNAPGADVQNALYIQALPYQRMDEYTSSAKNFTDVLSGFFALDSSSAYGGTLMTSLANGTGGNLIRRTSANDPALNFHRDVKDLVELDIALDGVLIDAKKDGFGGRKETLSFCVTNGYDLTVKVFGCPLVTSNEILGEWLLYSRVLTPDERANIESYLMRKWQGALRPGFGESREMTVVGDGVVAVANPKALPDLDVGFTGAIELTKTTWSFTLEQGSTTAKDAWLFPERTVTAPAAVTVDLDVSAVRQGKFLLASAGTFAEGTVFTLGTLVNPRDRTVALVREDNALYATVEPKGLLLIAR